MPFKALLSFHTGLLIHAAQSLKTKYSNSERKMVNKKINNHKTVKVTSFSLKRCL